MQLLGTIVGQERVSLVEVEGARIASVREAHTSDARGDVLGGADCLIAPALLDMQVNGFAGRSFNAPGVTADDVAAVADALHAAGVGLFCPTVTTGPFERMRASLAAVADACEQGLEPCVPAVHLEGPYISAEDGPRGAHPVEHVCEPDADEFERLQEAAGGRIGVVTLAPELPGALPFIEALSRSGLVPAIGHTSAEPGVIRDAVRAGARLSTHLGNGAHAMLPRHPNYVWEQLACDELWASVIPDGHHLPPAVLKCFVRCKGTERTILVSDAVRLAGMPPGRYEYAGRAVELTPEGRVRLEGTPYLAGSALELPRGVANAARFALLSLAEAIRMATLNPARLLGVGDRFGAVEPGREATLCAFRMEDEVLRSRVTLVRGEVVYRAGTDN
jgi:N-acetylglucosamine-6-phosphate deacetylase